ncbi:HEAT repeat domain-containing protein [Pseudomonas lini]
MSTIRNWLNKLKNKQAPSSSWADRRRNEALELLADVESDSTWVELSTHYNGFIREVAVRALCSQPSPEALVVLIERLNDWVAQVRDLAAAGLKHYLSPSQAQALLFALEPLIALAVRRRADHGPTLMAVRAVLQSPDIRDYVYTNFLTRQGKAARYLFALLLEQDTAPQMLIRSALAHRELSVRLIAVSACQELPVAQARLLLLEALTRPGAKVRVCVLRALLPLLDDPKPVLRKALIDISPSIRGLARWAAPHSKVDAHVVLTEQLNQDMPTAKRDWLGILGLAAELNIDLPQPWYTAALRSMYSTVRQAAVRLLRDDQLQELFGALDDPSDKVFFAAIAQFNKQPWTSMKARLGAKLDRDWPDLPTARRQAILQLLPGWQQLAYLLGRLDTEPALQAFWLRQVNLWCDRQYQMVDPVTPKAEREALAEKLQKLAAQPSQCFRMTDA